ncbi:recombinase RecA [Mycoplasmoides alvi]|uniref:recombinase RecA n=1 Tax=Mycoplasmoides alvi TaxID=78580 RepID=UPI00069706C2|nr:recombinase RecA [Mycoplasmoides alvi]
MSSNDDKIYLEALKELQKKYGKENLSLLNDKDKLDVKSISTGSFKLNKALGVGGFPCGRIIEIYGNESSGKTTLALQAVRECQKNNGRAAYIDLECALDMNYMKNLGIDLNKLLIAHPEYGEQAFSIIEALVKTNMIDLIVLDSVAALVPKAELETNIEDQSIGLLPRLMSKCLRRLQTIMFNSSVCIIFINQIREKIGIIYGNPEITPGGKALKFYSSIRVEIKRTEILKENNENIGIKSKITIVKNKLSSPLKIFYLDFYFNKGVDYFAEIIDLAIQTDLIQKNGSWYSYNNNKLCQGRSGLLQLMHNDLKLFKDIESKYIKKNTLS